MSLLVGLRTGLNVGLRPGLNGLWPSGLSGAAGITDASTLNAACGSSITWQNLWKGNETSGTTTTDLIGSDDLADSGTPTRNTTPTNLNEKAIAFTSNSTDALDAAGNTVADPGSSNFVIVGCIDDYTVTTANRGIVAKRDPSAPNNGWTINGASGPGLTAIVDSASGTSSRSVTGSAGGLWTFAVVRETANNVFNLYTSQGNSTGGTFNETIANTVVMSVGQDDLRNCNVFNFGILAYAEGQANGAFIEANHDAFQAVVGA